MKFTLRLSGKVATEIPRELDQPHNALKLVRDVSALPTMREVSITLIRNGTVVAEAKWNNKREVHDYSAGPGWEPIRAQACIKANIAAQAIAFAVINGTSPNPDDVAAFKTLSHLLRHDTEE